MSNNITVNTNQNPYFDDFDENKKFHQVMYKPALPVQARELTTQQSITRNQIKQFGDHVFKNGSKVTGAEAVLNLEYEYVKLQSQFNSVDIDVSSFSGKTIVGNESGTKAYVLGYSAFDSTTNDPDTIFVKYITGGSITDKVQGIKVTNGGTGYTVAPTVVITGGGGSGATATANISSGTVISIDVNTGGSAYTSAPTISFSGGSGSGTIATSTVETSPAFLGGERISDTSFIVSALAKASTPTGTGSSVSISDGVFYINGNFIKIEQQSLVLEKYSNTPSYKIGVSVAEVLVSSGEDSTLLDNSQGSTNFAAPGADRLKLSLSLSKKTITSIDDTDFYEIIRINNGIKEQDIAVPLYSKLEETFARRTFDESGSYTVRSFNIQLKDDPSDDTKFIVRLDPGKAFIEGFEYETIVSSDLKLDKARTIVNVNNFDRLMQYGNYVVTKEYSGFFNIATNQEVDLHNAAHGSLILVSPSTYENTKIGTAKIRNIDYVSGTGTSKIINLYLYDVKITSSTFASVESIVVPESPLSGVIDFIAKANIDNTGKVGGTAGGDAKLFETSDNTLVFKLPQDTIKTIRDSSSVIDTSYTTRRTYESVSFTAGVATIATAGSTETFFGTGALSDSNKREHYLATVKTVGTSSFSVGDIIAFDGSGTITVNAPSNTSATLDANTSTNFTADIIATVNIDSKQEKIKSLTKCCPLTIAAPNTTVLSTDSLTKSDVWKLRAVYDSESLSTAPVLPTLNVAVTSETLTAGETITGLTTGATGLVIEGASGTSTVTYVVVSGTFVVESVIGSTTGYTKVVSSVLTGDTNITTKYDLDNGQRDNFYDHGNIKLKIGETGPTGQITAIFDIFQHTGVGYLSVDSYTSAIGFDNVPQYTSPISGETVELRDCIDFRPRRSDGATTISNIELPVPNTNWSADYSYYLPRTDTVYLSRERKFGSNTGVPSLTTIPPVRLDGTMNLYNIFIPAYTFKANDVVTQYIENKRYTMRDIGRLEKRINNLEYYTSLSLLEADTESLVIKDTTGLDRFKNGLLVDPFNGHSVGNVTSNDYKCAIDFDEKILRPSFNSNLTDVIFDSTSSTGVQKTGDLVTLPYSSIALVTQTIASQSINVNPFAVLAWIGTVNLTPPNDNWIDTTTQPEVIVNIQGENDAWERLVGLSFGTQFNDWQNFGTGRDRTIANRRFWSGRALISSSTVERTLTQSRTGIRNEITGTDTVRNSIGERIVDVSVVPFIRARDLTISVTGMKPNTRVYPFFDGEAISLYCKPSGGTLNDALYTDSAGSLTGVVFSIPNSDTLRFRTGERQFLFTDNTSGDLVTASTYAEVIYQAQGLLQTKENVVVASRVPRIQTFGTGSAVDFRTTTNTFTRNSVIGWNDPLAQTFLIDAALYPDGVFLSDLDLYFKTKDTDGIPVSIQIRDTLNGYPAQTILPFSDVSLNPSSVNISEDASSATKFTFPSLVYLQPGEYAIVVMSNSLKYEAYISQMGENIIGTTRKVSEQPYAGVFFKSQNASTWTPDQNQDLTFQLNRANFTTGATADAIFKDGVSSSDIKADIIQIVPQEVRINNTLIDWSFKMTSVSTSILDADYSTITQNDNYQLESQRKITTSAGSYVSKASLLSINSHISPVIDTARNSVITIENIINNVITNETDSEGGDALARYLTRRITLKDGFDATDLKVYLTANRQSGTTISVYYKILSQFDSELFDDRPWVIMGETTNSKTVSRTDSENDYLELEYSTTTSNTNYITNSVTYDSFKTFAVKIVMTSSTTTKVPLIKDLRAIALA
jgi:hypothetical protein